MYKVVLFFWIVVGGIGAASSLVSERKKRLHLLAILIDMLEQMHYEITRWSMPIEEIFLAMDQKKEGVQQAFIEAILIGIKEKKAESLHTIWQKATSEIKGYIYLNKEIKDTFESLFIETSLDVIQQGRAVEKRIESLKNIEQRLSKQYQEEQKLVLSLGFFVSVFLCLIVL